MEKRVERDAQAERCGARLAALESEECRVLEWAGKGHIEEAAMLR